MKHILEENKGLTYSNGTVEFQKKQLVLALDDSEQHGTEKRLLNRSHWFLLAQSH